MTIWSGIAKGSKTLRSGSGRPRYRPSSPGRGAFASTTRATLCMRLRKRRGILASACSTSRSNSSGCTVTIHPSSPAARIRRRRKSRIIAEILIVARRKTMQRFSAVLVAAGIAAAATSIWAASADSQDAIVHALRANEEQWNRDFAAKNVDKLAAHYASDAVLMSPGTPPATGLDAIRRELKEMVGDQSLSLKFHASRVDVSQSGDLAYTQGTYQLTVTDPATKKPVHDAGTYVT